MPEKQQTGRSGNKIFTSLVIWAAIITAIIAGIWFGHKKSPKSVISGKLGEVEKDSAVVKKVIRKSPPPEEPQPVVDYEKLDKDEAFTDMMRQRKEEYTVDESIDVMVKPDESVKVADSTVPMQDILEDIRLKEGEVIEKDLSGRPAAPRVMEPTVPFQKERKDNEFGINLKSEKKPDMYGIHVVQPGDNVWNVHFAFLKHYFDKKGIRLSPVADEPNQYGRSTGVGKILKFSEKMVYIYNIGERRLVGDLHLIHPRSKIVVFNMERVFSLLDEIDQKNISSIEFDGETLWIPAAQ